MELELQNADEMFISDSLLLRSFVGVQGTCSVTADDASEAELEDEIRKKVTVKADDGEVANVDLTSVTRDENVTAKGRWEAALSLPHTQSWSVEEVESNAVDAIEIDGDGDVETVKYGYSRPAHEYLPDEWIQLGEDVDGLNDVAPGVEEQWVHERLLFITGLVEIEDEESTSYAIVELSPPVPTPYDLVRYTAYSSREVAETDLYRYMASIHAAYEQDVERPVEASRNRYSFTGSEIEPPNLTRRDFEKVEDGVNRFEMQSLPRRPLKDEEVDTVLESYEGLTDGDCVLLLPDDPFFVEDAAKRAQNIASGEHVAFTITTPDGEFVVFELEEQEEGMGWIRKEGKLSIAETFS